MIAAVFASLAVACTPFSVGHIDRHGNEPRADYYRLCSNHLTMALPPRTAVSDELAIHGNTHVLSLTRVTVRGRRQRADWHDDYVRFGPVYFDGDTAVNTSYTRWANVYGVIN